MHLLRVRPVLLLHGLLHKVLPLYQLVNAPRQQISSSTRLIDPASSKQEICIMKD